MTKDQIEQWIADNGGADAIRASSNQKTVANPARSDPYSEDYDPSAPKQITVEVITWKNPRTGATLTATRLPGEQYEDISTVPANTTATSATPREVERHTDDDGTTWIQYDDGRWVKQGPSAAEQRQRQQDKEQAGKRIVSVAYEGTGRNRVKVTTYANGETAREDSPTEKKAVSVTYDADGTRVTTYDDASQTREAPSPTEQRAAARENRPQIVSAPSGQRRIAQMDAEGNITSVDNPLFDEAAYERQAAKERAQAERDRLSLQIEAGKLTEASAAAQYKRWFDENVTIPLQRAQEARARAAELRAAQEAEDRRQQFAATYEKDRQTTAISAGNQAANAFNSNLQYQVGPKFGEQFAQALNSFQPGAPPANFTADAFTFKGPSIEAVARKATAKALAGISPYAQAIATAGERPLQVASYGGGTEVGGGAPPPTAAPVDYAGMINQYLQNNPYVPGGGGDEEDQ
jgi:hypothetical protein